MVPAPVRLARHVARREKANARERNRMHGQNAVLARLLQCLPLSWCRGAPHKLSKIEILRLAINYLRLLRCLLRENERDGSWGPWLDASVLLNALSPGLSRATASRLSAHRLMEPGFQTHSPGFGIAGEATAKRAQWIGAERHAERTATFFMPLEADAGIEAQTSDVDSMGASECAEAFVIPMCGDISERLLEDCFYEPIDSSLSPHSSPYWFDSAFLPSD